MKTIKAKISPKGEVRILETVKLESERDAILVILDTIPSPVKTKLKDQIGTAKGCYKDAGEADSYIRSLREEWT